MNIPTSCGSCQYGNTFDLSVDDLCTYCFILDQEEEWCNFPNRKDKTLRMRGCPLPNITKEQLKQANNKIKIHKLKERVLYKAIKGRTKLIRKRNVSRLKKIAKK